MTFKVLPICDHDMDNILLNIRCLIWVMSPISLHSKHNWISNINLYFMYEIISNQIHILWNRNSICVIFVYVLPGTQSVHRYRIISSQLVSLLYSWFNIMPSAQINVTNNFSSYIYTNWMIIQFKLTVLNWISYN